MLSEFLAALVAALVATTGVQLAEAPQGASPSDPVPIEGDQDVVPSETPSLEDSPVEELTPTDEGPCPAPDPPGTGHEFLFAPGEGLRVTYSLAARVSFQYWVSGSMPRSALGFEGRSTAAALIEDQSNGFVVGDYAFGFLSYDRGVHASSDFGGAPVVLQEGDLGDCGQISAPRVYTIGPGTFAITVWGSSDAEAQFGFIIPGSATLQAVQPIASVRLSEDEMSCASKVRTTASGVSTTRLSGCIQSVSVQNRALRWLWVGTTPDEDHQVQWVAPSGAVTSVTSQWHGDHAGAGIWRLEVPIYQSPVGTPLNPVRSTVPEDWGIFGAVALIP